MSAPEPPDVPAAASASTTKVHGAQTSIAPATTVGAQALGGGINAPNSQLVIVTNNNGQINVGLPGGYTRLSLGRTESIAGLILVLGLVGLGLAGQIAEPAKIIVTLAGLGSSVASLVIGLASWSGRRFGFDPTAAARDGALAGLIAAAVGAYVSVSHSASIEGGIRLAVVCMVAMIPTGALWALLIGCLVGNNSHQGRVASALTLVCVAIAWGGLIAFAAPKAPSIGSQALSATLLCVLVTSFLLLFGVLVMRKLNWVGLAIGLMIECLLLAVGYALAQSAIRFTFYSDAAARAAFSGILAILLVGGTLLVAVSRGLASRVALLVNRGKEDNS